MKNKLCPRQGFSVCGCWLWVLPQPAPTERQRRRTRKRKRKKGTFVPKTGSDPPKSFDLGCFSPTNFTASFQTNFLTHPPPRTPLPPGPLPPQTAQNFEFSFPSFPFSLFSLGRSSRGIVGRGRPLGVSQTDPSEPKRTIWREAWRFCDPVCALCAREAVSAAGCKQERETNARHERNIDEKMGLRTRDHTNCLHLAQECEALLTQRRCVPSPQILSLNHPSYTISLYLSACSYISLRCSMGCLQSRSATCPATANILEQMASEVDTEKSPLTPVRDKQL